MREESYRSIPVAAKLNNRMDSMNMKSYSIIASVLSSLLLVGCGGDKAEQPAKKSSDPILSLISVSDGFTIAGKPAISFYFGKDESNYCDITVPKEEIKTGTLIKSQSMNNTSIDGNCSWNKKSYALSAKHPTYTSLDVISVIPDKIEINASLKVINTSSLNEFVEFKNISLQIVNPDDIRKLLK